MGVTLWRGGMLEVTWESPVALTGVVALAVELVLVRVRELVVGELVLERERAAGGPRAEEWTLLRTVSLLLLAVCASLWSMWDDSTSWVGEVHV